MIAPTAGWNLHKVSQFHCRAEGYLHHSVSNPKQYTEGKHEGSKVVSVGADEESCERHNRAENHQDSCTPSIEHWANDDAAGEEEPKLRAGDPSNLDSIEDTLVFVVVLVRAKRVQEAYSVTLVSGTSGSCPLLRS